MKPQINCVSCGQELNDQPNDFMVCPKCGRVNIRDGESSIPTIQQPVLQPVSITSQRQFITKLKSIRPPLLIFLSLMLIALLGGAVFALHSFVLKPKAATPVVSMPAKNVSKPTVLPSSHPPSNNTVSTTKPPSTTPSPSPKTGSTSSSCFQVSGIATRSTRDRPDDNTTDYKLHLVYVIPSDGTDNHYDTNGRIADSVSSWENWLCQQTGGKYLRLDTYKGALDVTFVQLNATDNTIKTGSDLPWSTDSNNNPYIRDDLQIHLQSLGFTDPHKLYAVYYGGTSNHSCGGGAYPPTLPGHVSAEYMHGGDPGAPDCSVNQLASSPTQAPGYFEYDILHETIHTLGFIPSCAPHNTRTAHVSDSTRDLMYAGSQPWDIADGLVLDYNHDDYYDANIAGCIDLINSAFLVGGGNQLPPSW